MRRFTVQDLDTLNEWRGGHGLEPLTSALLPAAGFIVEGVAVGFLLRTESPDVAIIDSFLTNPKAPLRARHLACYELALELETFGRAVGLKRLIAFTASTGIARVARVLGYEASDSVILSRQVAA